MKTFVLAALIGLTLSVSQPARAQQNDMAPPVEAQEDTVREQHAVHDFRVNEDPNDTYREREIEALCSNEDALAGRCMLVARLPRCPGDPRCPDPTRVRPDSETPE